jgi:hypothetical protein
LYNRTKPVYCQWSLFWIKQKKKKRYVSSSCGFDF